MRNYIPHQHSQQRHSRQYHSQQYRSAYTLVELLVAMTLSLFLLLAVAELFRQVGGAMNDTRTAMTTSAHLAETAMLLRHDLSRIAPTLLDKPFDIAKEKDVGDNDGYLEIFEGPNTHLDHPYRNDDGVPDQTVGDVDDFIAFTITDPDVPFRGLIFDAADRLRIEERHSAEVVWFVRGNTLYRRVRLIDDLNPDNTKKHTDLARRENRFGHDGRPGAEFPYPLYTGDATGWQYLRMPLLEEFLHGNWSDGDWATGLPATPEIPRPDMWEQPHFFPGLQDAKSGALTRYASQSVRTGEDVVLTNVLSFDIEVWDSTTKSYVNLGTPDTTWATSNHSALNTTWDSWTRTYSGEQPPFTARLEAVRFTIRCFDPSSKTIKQITVVHNF